MSHPFLIFLQRWMVVTLAVLGAAHIVTGIRYDSVGGLLAASLLLGILNTFLRPIMQLVSLPLLILTLGIFNLFINALLLYLVAAFVKSFHVDTFGAAFWGGLVISLVSIGINRLTGKPQNRIVIRSHRPSDRKNAQDDDGPVIDV
jgi:putative membrane protein